MSLLSLEPGLVVRRGSRTLEMIRLLEDNKIQFEDQLTRSVTTFALAKFHSMLQAGQLTRVFDFP